MRYREIPEVPFSDAVASLGGADPTIAARNVIAIALHSPDLDSSTELLLQAYSHPDHTVRGNAILGFGHLARRFGRLDAGRLLPIVEEALRDPDPYVRGQAESAADDLAHFLGWRIAGRADA